VGGRDGRGSRLLRHVLHDPVDELGYPGAHAGQVVLGAPDAPTDDARQEVAAVLTPHLQRTARVTLKA